LCTFYVFKYYDYYQIHYEYLIFHYFVICIVFCKVKKWCTFIIQYVYNYYCAHNCCYIILYVFFLVNVDMKLTERNNYYSVLVFLSDMIPLYKCYDFIRYLYVFIFTALLYLTNWIKTFVLLFFFFVKIHKKKPLILVDDWQGIL